MHAQASHHRPHHHRHTVSDVMAGVVVLGLGFTVLCIAMMEAGAYDGVPWHTLGIGIGIPTALLASFVCLRRAFEDAE